MFSQTQDYALRAIIWIAQQEEAKPYGNEQIARGTKVAPSYMAKVLQHLTEADILGSRRGVGGGFHLIRDIDELTVLEVINAVDPIVRITACPLDLTTHRDCRCPMHARLDEALGLVERALRKSTIRDVLYEKGRPPPLQDTHSSNRRS
ncbi:MAG: Rrf2 family transcriptional regulator [Planctomycetales bacterium]|nr:Rrf2 family transcriptional regulator [Planctomycetales bacterium]